LITAAILAGGSSTRFTFNKLLYPIKGKPLLQHVVDKIRKCKSITKAVLVVTPLHSGTFSDIDVEMVIDFLGIGPIGGIYTALKMFREVIVVGGDMPFINCEFIDTILSFCREYEYACLPIWRKTGFLEPLAGVYSKDFISLLEQAISINELSIQRVIKRFNLNIKIVSIEDQMNEISNVFININRFEDIKEVEEKL